MMKSEIKEPLVPKKQISDPKTGNQNAQSSKFATLRSLTMLSKNTGMNSPQNSDKFS